MLQSALNLKQADVLCHYGAHYSLRLMFSNYSSAYLAPWFCPTWTAHVSGMEFGRIVYIITPLTPVCQQIWFSGYPLNTAKAFLNPKYFSCINCWGMSTHLMQVDLQYKWQKLLMFLVRQALILHGQICDLVFRLILVKVDMHVVSSNEIFKQDIWVGWQGSFIAILNVVP